MEKLYYPSVLSYPAQSVVCNFLRVDIELFVSSLPGDEGKSGGNIEVRSVWKE